MFTNISFNPLAFLENLHYLAKGMLCIIIVMLVLIIITTLLNKIPSKSNDNDK